MSGQKVRIPLVCVDNLDVVRLLGCEIRACELSSGKELVQSTLLCDGAHLDPGGILFVVDEVLLASRVVDSGYGC